MHARTYAYSLHERSLSSLSCLNVCLSCLLSCLSSSVLSVFRLLLLSFVFCLLPFVFCLLYFVFCLLYFIYRLLYFIYHPRFIYFPRFIYLLSYACCEWESSIIIAIIVGHSCVVRISRLCRTIVALMAEQMLIYWVR